jgi:hypothetical protein
LQSRFSIRKIYTISSPSPPKRLCPGFFSATLSELAALCEQTRKHENNPTSTGIRSTLKALQKNLYEKKAQNVEVSS